MTIFDRIINWCNGDFSSSRSIPLSPDVKALVDTMQITAIQYSPWKYTSGSGRDHTFFEKITIDSDVMVLTIESRHIPTSTAKAYARADYNMPSTAATVEIVGRPVPLTAYEQRLIYREIIVPFRKWHDSVIDHDQQKSLHLFVSKVIATLKKPGHPYEGI